MPGARFRCWGEPRTMIRPPRSAQSRANSPRYCGRLSAHGRVGAGQMEALGLGEQPVQADDFQPGLLGLLPHFGSPGGRNGKGTGPISAKHPRAVPGNWTCPRHRERRDLDAPVAALGGESKRLLERPIAEQLVADGVFESLRPGGVFASGLFQRERKKGRGGRPAAATFVRSWRRLRAAFRRCMGHPFAATNSATIRHADGCRNLLHCSRKRKRRVDAAAKREFALVAPACFRHTLRIVLQPLFRRLAVRLGGHRGGGDWRRRRPGSSPSTPRPASGSP